MNNVSWRHHYIPEFYLKGFTNSNGKFKIFDVEQQRFIRQGKEFSSESYFFEVDGNTVVNENGASDFIEKLYSKTDDRISKLFDKIRNAQSDTRFGVTEDDMPALQHFVSIMFWRLPINYNQVKYLIKEKDLNELGLLINSKETGEVLRDSVLERRLKSDPNFFRALKQILPYLTYKRIFDCTTPLTIQAFPNGLPALCSDNPIIFEKSIFPDVYFDDFIFPLTNNLVFIRGKQINNIMTSIKVAIDLILMKQARKYVSCTDELYIESLNNLYDKHYKSVDELKSRVFQDLIGKFP